MFPQSHNNYHVIHIVIWSYHHVIWPSNYFTIMLFYHYVILPSCYLTKLFYLHVILPLCYLTIMLFKNLHDPKIKAAVLQCVCVCVSGVAQIRTYCECINLPSFFFFPSLIRLMVSVDIILTYIYLFTYFCCCWGWFPDSFRTSPGSPEAGFASSCSSRWKVEGPFSVISIAAVSQSPEPTGVCWCGGQHWVRLLCPICVQV